MAIYRRSVPRLRSAYLIAASAAVVLSSCGTPRDEPGSSTSAVGMPPATSEPSSVSAPAPTFAAPLAEGATLSVDELARRALANNPSRAIAESNQAAARAEVLQARAWANPELEVGAGRARAREGNDSNSIGEVRLEQRFELPGKRSSRISAAEGAQAVAESERRSFQAGLIADVRQASITVVQSQTAVELADQARLVAKEVLDTVTVRVNAGEADRSELTRAQVEQLQAAQQLASRQRDLTTARIAVNVLCGRTLPNDFTIADPAEAPLAVESLSQALAAVPQHPEVSRRRAVLQQAQAVRRREDAAWQPDITVGGFVAREADTNDTGVSVGVDVPLWNRNQGGIASAQAQISRADAELRQAELATAAAIEIAWTRVQAAKAQATAFAGALSSSSQEALKLVLARYQAGEADLLQVLDARRTAAAIAQQGLEARTELQSAIITLDQALGRIGVQP